MATNITLDGGSRFRITRPLTTTSGFVSDVDVTVKQHLSELNTLLSKSIFNQDRAGRPDIKDILNSPLTPKRIPAGKGDEWSQGSLANRFDTDQAAQFSLADYIDITADLSKLKYAFEDSLSSNWFTLEYNAKVVLDGNPAIRDYLIAYAHNIGKLHDVNGLRNYILANLHGVKNVANYAIVSAARSLIDQEQLNVPDYNRDASDIVIALKGARLSLSSASFRTGAQAVIDNFIFNKTESDLIDAFDQEGLGPVPAGIKPLLIKYMKASPIPLTPANANAWIPLFIQQIQGSTQIAAPNEVDTDEADKDFDVDFLQDDTSTIQVSKSAVKCASQLYYAMILGDELNVFDVTNYFTHKYLIRGGIEIQDSRLRDDLQLYVFSNKFTDLKTKRIEDRTRPAERQMFYRQVFNEGNGQITEDVIVNREFPKLWKVLILESAKYLERAQTTFNQNSLSPQNVMQAVEDLQYNLSTHCTGMANVITPLIYAELNFVIQRIFMHPEVLRQVVPQGATWWRVVETLYMGMKHSRPKSTVIYNKAKLGHDIIRAIADYDPSQFENDQNFSNFISIVDAFITTQSILQEALTDDLKKGDEEEPGKNGYHKTMPDSPAMTAAPGANVGPKAGGDEWDF